MTTNFHKWFVGLLKLNKLKNFKCPWSYRMLAWKWVEIDWSTYHPRKNLSTTKKNWWKYTKFHSFVIYRNFYNFFLETCNVSNEVKFDLHTLIHFQDWLHQMCSILSLTYRWSENRIGRQDVQYCHALLSEFRILNKTLYQCKMTTLIYWNRNNHVENI